MGISRVHYRERQRLTAADLRAEQDYRLGLVRRHHLAPHQWGVVRGLEVVNVDSRYLLMPGVAIDGYGRELLVTEPFDLDVDGTPDCLFVTLYYCEFPEDATPGRTCHDTPAPRIAQRVKVVTGALVTPPSDSDDLIIAQPRNARPWPVVVDAIGEQEACRVKRHDAVRYVRHRASQVRSPSARARITLGLERRTDVYHFLVSTAASAALQPRLGIDRDGVTQVWKRLIIWGSKQVAAIAAMGSPIVRVEVPFVAGPLQRLQIVGVLDLTQRQPSIGLVPFVGAPIPLLRSGPLTQTFRLSRLPQSLKVGSHEATLKVIGEAGPPVRPTEPAPFSIVMNAAGGLLAMLPSELAKVEKPFRCEAIERERAAAGGEATAAVVFRPAAAIVDDPSAREVYALTTSAADAPVAETTVRLSGGAEDKTDVSTRISIGRSPTNARGDWVPRVRMDGGRRIDILATKQTDPALDVEGTLYLPAIGKDDPLMPDMMAMAFMAGLRQAGKIATATAAFEIATPTPPISVKRGDPFSYTVRNLPTTGVRRVVELISGIAGTHDLTFRSIALPLQNNTIKIDSFRHTASKVQLQLVLLTATGNASPKLVIAPPLSIDVTN